MREGPIPWHSRPILAPLVYGFCTLLVGGLAFPFGYLLMGRIRHGLYSVLFMDSLMVLYLMASVKGKTKDGSSSDRGPGAQTQHRSSLG